MGVFGKRTREREKDFLRENPRTTLRTGGGGAAASAGGGREDKIQLLREAKKETSSSRSFCVRDTMMMMSSRERQKRTDEEDDFKGVPKIERRTQRERRLFVPDEEKAGRSPPARRDTKDGIAGRTLAESGYGNVERRKVLDPPRKNHGIFPGDCRETNGSASTETRRREKKQKKTTTKTTRPRVSENFPNTRANPNGSVKSI